MKSENEGLLKVLYEERKPLVILIQETKNKLAILEKWKERLDANIKDLE